MRSIYLLRHGETVWNRAKRLQGHKDTPLTLKGVQQARAMGCKLHQVLEGIQPSAFFSSPIGRSHQTAIIVADSINFDTELIVLKKELKEITFGKWDGLNMQEILLGYLLQKFVSLCLHKEEDPAEMPLNLFSLNSELFSYILNKQGSSWETIFFSL